ncbi:GMC oxidoreductase [Streptomyces sp. ME19-01-6]|uniref:GMC oxidoreductase n=1 Tax=Streptomyces sp. ME19-01-6 TaxID=3028686 RepID=UPI0029AAFAA2|nr:GMC oxidoreductase [Streptomyces sp. ME19-01-6]MDX3224956.1 GMC oxidoreductase [Streptomyces sp. ME19-01-6]
MTASGARGRLTPRREPDVIIIGAGTFGSVLAWQLGQGGDRVATLLLESGRLQRTEHVQNAPLAEETVPPPGLLEPAASPPAGNGRWRVPWRSQLPYHGLAYGVGGRSLFWGAYCVWPVLDQDGIRDRWPAGVMAELSSRYLPAAAELLGLSRVAPHFDGELNRRLRGRLLGALTGNRLPGLLPPSELPDPPPAHDARAGGGHRDGHVARLNMPLAIDAIDATEDAAGGSPRLVRFSSAPLLTDRLGDGTGDLELLTDCHVAGLQASGGKITAIDTSRGRLRVPDRAVVVLAVGTIENARLVLGANGLPHAARPVHHLTTHLRSNLTVRVPFPFDSSRGPAHAWGAAALHARGACRHPSGPDTRFHHQITAYGVGSLPEEVARRLYSDTPRYDVEALDRMLRIPPRYLVVTLASVAEMAAEGTGEVSLLDERDTFGARLAYVRLSPGPADQRTWDSMDRSADTVVRTLLGDGRIEVLRSGRFVPVAADRPTAVLEPEERREPPGCGHHEMGTLRMGADPRDAHTDADGRIHATRNLYVAGPAVFPALDSAGPVLPGVALTLRLADHLRHTMRTGDRTYPLRMPSASPGVT